MVDCDNICEISQLIWFTVFLTGYSLSILFWIANSPSGHFFQWLYFNIPVLLIELILILRTLKAGKNKLHISINDQQLCIERNEQSNIYSLDQIGKVTISRLNLIRCFQVYDISGNRVLQMRDIGGECTDVFTWLTK
jgi:hypothetical protein